MSMSLVSRLDATIAFQPEPMQTIVSYEDRGPGQVETHIVRRWANAHAARCRLCERCVFTPGEDGQGLCHVAVSGRVPASQAPMYSAPSH